jgi:hypothetical protein
MKNKAAFILLVLSFSCSREQKPLLTEEEKGNIVIEVKETLDNYYADIRSGGLTAEFKYLDNSKDFYWTPPGYNKPISYDSVACVLKKNAGNYKEIDNAFENLTIEAISLDSASYSGKIRSSITDTTNNSTTIYLNEKGKLIKRKDGWKLLNGETSVSLSGK